MAKTKPVLILQLRPEDATSDSEYRCFLKYAQLQAEDTKMCRRDLNVTKNWLENNPSGTFNRKGIKFEGEALHSGVFSDQGV